VVGDIPVKIWLMMENTVNYNNKPDIRIFDEIDKLAEQFYQLIFTTVKNKEDGLKTSIAFSGGNTPAKIFDYISATHKDDLDWNKINFFWVDERCVPPDHAESNFKMTKEHLLDKVGVNNKNIFRVFGEAQPAIEAKRYSDKIVDNLEIKYGLPAFDLIFLGMGDDGHTASIFPGNNILFDSDKVCEVAIHPVSGQSRITLTGRIINNASVIAFLVTGSSKSEKMAEIVLKGETSGYPASLVNPVHGKLIWLLDKEASVKLYI
jgi:6-phosphogluconolactonase